MIKSIIKRVIVGVGVALALMFIKGNLITMVSAKSIISYKANSEVYTFNNTDTSFTTTFNNSFFSNVGVGHVYFNFNINKVSGISTAPVSLIRSAILFTGNSGYVCKIGSPSLSNSTYGGITYSADCPINIGSSGLTKITFITTDLQANDQSLYRWTMDGYFTFESDANINFDTSGTTNAINNQIINDNANTQSIIDSISNGNSVSIINDNANTQSIINNQNNNTTSIINNQNNNANSIIQSQNDLMQDCRPSINLWGGFNYTREYRGLTFKYQQDGTINVVGTASQDATSITASTILTNDWYVSLSPGTYVLSGGLNSNAYLQVITTDGTNLATSTSTARSFTISSTTDVYVRVYVKSGTAVNHTFKVMLQSGSTPSTFEEYGGNICFNKLDRNNQTNEGIRQAQENTNSIISNHDTTQANATADSFFTNFTIDTHGLTAIVSAPLRLFSSLLGANCTSLRFQLPFVHNEVQLQCMSSIYTTYFNTFLTIYRLITDGIIAYWVSVKVFQKVKGFLDPTNDKVEVFDL